MAYMLDALKWKSLQQCRANNHLLMPYRIVNTQMVIEPSKFLRISNSRTGGAKKRIRSILNAPNFTPAFSRRQSGNGMAFLPASLTILHWRASRGAWAVSQGQVLYCRELLLQLVHGNAIGVGLRKFTAAVGLHIQNHLW